MAISIKSLGLDRLGLEDRLLLVEERSGTALRLTAGAVLLTGPQRVELHRRLADHGTDPTQRHVMG